MFAVIMRMAACCPDPAIAIWCAPCQLALRWFVIANLVTCSDAPSNIMWDRRVVRGNTYASQTLTPVRSTRAQFSAIPAPTTAVHSTRGVTFPRVVTFRALPLASLFAWLRLCCCTLWACRDTSVHPGRDRAGSEACGGTAKGPGAGSVPSQQGGQQAPDAGARGGPPPHGRADRPVPGGAERQRRGCVPVPVPRHTPRGPVGWWLVKGPACLHGGSCIACNRVRGLWPHSAAACASASDTFIESQMSSRPSCKPCVCFHSIVCAHACVRVWACGRVYVCMCVYA